MRRALKGLLENPQNNLKIFKDGVVVYNENSEASDLENIFRQWFPNTDESSNNREEYLDLFCTLVEKALLSEFPNGNQDLNRNSMAVDISQDIQVLSRLNSEIVAKAKKMLYFTNEVAIEYSALKIDDGIIIIIIA